MLHVLDAKYVPDYRIWVSSDDGSNGVVNLSNFLKGPIFEPLQELDQFKAFTVDSELETVVWSNGADLAPELLKAHLEPNH